MHLKSLTLKGFKSFASSTTLVFEKGITAVVGPNGSGKSNVVDAIAWVLGEQGAKALRGGKMEDVIFAGTADRPPLGRAEVTLTIDNSDGALPIDYAEVSVTRRMFRDGGGEYEINGASCRLLDIQELLSDSGIGREMHVIVGQGRLDAVLQARPEDRRAFIEEAAGVLKHRKRRERAERRLTAMQANLTRLTDLTAELRRQLKPLGRQAEVARRAAGVQAEMRDSRARLLGHDLAELAGEIERETRDEQQAQEHRARVQQALTEVGAQERAAAAELAAAGPAHAVAQDTWFALSALAERFRGTVSLAQERARNLAAPVEPPRPGRDPDELEESAVRAEAAHAVLVAALRTARSAVDSAAGGRSDLEERLRSAEAELLRASRAVADRREGLARLTGQVNAARSRQSAADEEIQRLAGAVDGARDRAAQARISFEQLQDSVGDLDSSEEGLDEAHEAAADAAQTARARVAELTDALRAARTQETGLAARVDALALGLDRRDGTAALLEPGAVAGMLGLVAELVQITPGFETALAAALGPIADGVAVDGPAAAGSALALLRSADMGRAAMLVGAVGGTGSPAGIKTGPDSDSAARPELGPGARWAADVISSPAAVHAGLLVALADCVVVPDLPSATALVAAHPSLRAVTRAGDLVWRSGAVGGGPGGQTVLELRAVLDTARAELGSVRVRATELDAALAGAREEAGRRDEHAAVTLAALHESDATLSAVGEQLGRLGEAARSALAEAERLDRQRSAAEALREQHRHAVEDLQARLVDVQAQESPTEADPAGRDGLREEVAAARQVELEARLGLRTAEERVQTSSGTAEGLRRAARLERDAKARTEQAAARRTAAAATARQVVEAGQRTAARLEISLAAAASSRDAAGRDRLAAEQAAGEARTAAAELQRQWDTLTDAVHRDEVMRAQQTLRLDQLRERVAAEFSMTADELLAEFGPQVLVPPGPGELAEFEIARDRGEQVTEPQPVPFDLETQRRRARRAERDLALLGKVNPLALEEFAALEERHTFLSTQLEDLRSTRRDLLTVIAEVDGKILEVFTAAYHDVAREFVDVFATLFPGGDGELVLTDPSDMLTSGIEVHARPPGKKIKRLSLLSGGERSLTAVALLVAIFRARPSPFYIMDEVEAALDEVNLARLVGLLAELRSSSQLIIVTHQKHTMESADALYGVSMRGDGITQVISQRIRAAGSPLAQPRGTASIAG